MIQGTSVGTRGFHDTDPIPSLARSESTVCGKLDSIKDYTMK